MIENENQSCFTPPEFEDLLRLVTGIPQIKPLHQKSTTKDLHHLTSSQKRRITASQNRRAKINDLEEQLATLQIAKRKFFTHDNNADTNNLPIVLIDKITKIKQRLWAEKSRLKKYEADKSTLDRITYRDGDLEFDSKIADDYLFFHGLITYELAQWERFLGHPDRLEDGYREFSTTYKESQEKEFITENRFGKAYPKAREAAYNRLKTLSFSDPTFVSAQDGRWLILHMQNIINRLERERSLNSYLRKERDLTKENHHYRREKMKLPREERLLNPEIELDMINHNRPMKRLMKNFGCQITEDERKHLIATALKLKTKFEEIFIVK